MLLRELASCNLPAICSFDHNEDHSSIEHGNLFTVLHVFRVEQNDSDIRANELHFGVFCGDRGLLRPCVVNLFESFDDIRMPYYTHLRYRYPNGVLGEKAIKCLYVV